MILVFKYFFQILVLLNTVPTRYS